MENTIITCITFIVSLVMFVVSFRSFKEKGFLFNNAYLYASREERATMDKKPHYKQSAIAFLLLGVVFLIGALEMIFKIKWLFYIKVICAFITIAYAIISSIMITMKK
ncbi:DUF3784 domain-containing protein [Paeniclostridium sordellii]|uniref:DUF3784 domain-containing protein n=1 Tax=Paraclostridium sordellii TaxID=1505 RepID=UPI0005E86239|nr:DUF3784 domain-containing protein [Paeniclostridium sordellii]MVO70214.1 DUF3784 domain-containing protein [Paeniclostridium sordellii]CEQ27414.1 Domain of uncharacterised function (DUF3784) [[Clostridium] sordellii] [Paeniclostridium sordellii]